MKIRKRSIAVLSSNSTAHGDDEEERAKKDFLFPLVAAAMDVQAKAKAQLSQAPTNVSETETGVHSRKNWRNALLQFEAHNEITKIGAEDDKFDYRRNGIKRNAGHEFQPVTTKGRVEKTFKSKEEEEDLGLVRKIIDCPTKCDGIHHINAERRDYSDGNCSQTVFQNDDPKRKSKAHISDKEDDNNHGGGRCRRRNGRGWRCSERTLVGYSLCEHHLGKSRFKSINNSKGLVPAYSKGSKFKKLHLVHAASCKVDI